MNAPDLQTLNAYAANFETATDAAFTAAGIDLQKLLTHSNEAQAPSRVLISFTRGQAENLEVLANGAEVWDYFTNSILQISVHTSRYPEEDAPAFGAATLALHARIEADITTALMMSQTPFTAANLPYYTVNKITPQPVQRSTSEVYLEDITEMPFALDFGIKSTAWPTGMN